MSINEAIALLGLEPNYDEEKLKIAYKSKIRKTHPDLNPNLNNAKQLTQRINEAYELLKSNLKRNFNRSTNSSFNSSKTYDRSNDSTSNSKKTHNKNKDSEFNSEEIAFLFKKREIINKLIAEIAINQSSRIYTSVDYTSYLLKERLIYIEYIESIYSCSNMYELDLTIKKYSKKHCDLLKEFINNIFGIFSASFQNDDRSVITKIGYYVNNCDFKVNNSINLCMKYFINSKKQIIKQFISGKLFELFYSCPEVYKSYLPEDAKEYLMNKILNKNLEEVLKNPHIITDEFNNYVKYYTDEFNKQKKVKIEGLKKLLKLNKLRCYKKELKDLKLTNNKNNFNNKYAVLKKEIESFVKYKQNNDLEEKIAKCSKKLNEYYTKCKDKEIHNENYQLVLYYLAAVSKKELPIDVLDVLIDIKFKNVYEDFLVLESIELDFLTNNKNNVSYK